MIDDNNSELDNNDATSSVENAEQSNLDALIVMLDYILPEVREFSHHAAQLVSLARQVLIETKRAH